MLSCAGEALSLGAGAAAGVGTMQATKLADVVAVAEATVKSTTVVAVVVTSRVTAVVVVTSVCMAATEGGATVRWAAMAAAWELWVLWAQEA